MTWDGDVYRYIVSRRFGRVSVRTSIYKLTDKHSQSRTLLLEPGDGIVDREVVDPALVVLRERRGHLHISLCLCVLVGGERERGEGHDRLDP